MPIHKCFYFSNGGLRKKRKKKLSVEDLRLNLSNKKERKNEPSSVNERAHGALGDGRGLAAARRAELTDVLSEEGKMASTFDFTCKLSLGFISSYSSGSPL